MTAETGSLARRECLRDVWRHRHSNFTRSHEVQHVGAMEAIVAD